MLTIFMVNTMAMAIVLLMLMIVQELLTEVDWLYQYHYHSFTD